MVVARLFVKPHDVFAELLAGRGEHRRLGRIAAEEAGDVIGRAPHQAEGGLRPFLREQPPRTQVGVRLRNLVAAMHRRPGLGRGECHQLAVLGRRRDVVEPRERARRLAEGGMLGDVLDPFAVEEHLPAVVERFEIFRAGAQRFAAC